MQTKVSKYTIVGLVISFLSITGLSLLFSYLCGKPLSALPTISREALIFGCMGILFWIILKKENLTLQSIGLNNANWGQSMVNVLIGLVLSIGGIALSLGLINLLGLEFVSSGSINKSQFVVLLVVLRAGIVEEVFMRGFIYERLKSYLNSPIYAALLSTIPFALFHYNQGVAGIIISFILGSILMGMYMWRRDLKSNMITHFLVDFVPNILLVVML